MKVRQLDMHNFMPYKGNHTVQFPTDDFKNVMIILGDNMRGKTSLLNALRWGFYGKAVGRHSRRISLPALVNRDAAAEDDWKMEVFVQFEVNNSLYDLRRSADRRSYIANPTKVEHFDVQTHLSRDGVVIAGDQIEREISMFAPEQTSRFFLFDGELLQEYEELLIENSDQGRLIKKAIEQVLGVPTLIQGRDELGAIRKSATKKQLAELTQIQSLQKRAEQSSVLASQLDNYETDVISLKDQLQAVRQEREALDDILDNATAALTAQSTLETLRSSLKDLDAVRATKTEERLDLIEESWIDLLDMKLRIRREQLRSRQKNLVLANDSQVRTRLKIEEIRRSLDSHVCPTCGQEMSLARREDLGSELGRLEGEILKSADLTSRQMTIAAELASLDRIKGVNVRERLLSIERDLRVADVSAQTTENKIEQIEDEVAGYDTVELARQRSLRAAKLKEEGRLGLAIDQAERLRNKTHDDLAIAQKSLEGIGIAGERRSTIKVSLVTDLERVFDASVERLRDRLRQRIGELASEAFREMTTQKAYQGLEIDSNYGLTIVDDQGRSVPLRSAGAEQVVALSLIDGLNRTSRAVGPVIMDTPFGRLDLSHRGNILTYLPTVTSQFVLLVHSGEIRPEQDLVTIKSRIGMSYRIEEVSATQSRIERVNL